MFCQYLPLLPRLPPKKKETEEEAPPTLHVQMYTLCLVFRSIPTYIYMPSSCRSRRTVVQQDTPPQASAGGIRAEKNSHAPFLGGGVKHGRTPRLIGHVCKRRLLFSFRVLPGAARSCGSPTTCLEGGGGKDGTDWMAGPDSPQDRSGLLS